MEHHQRVVSPISIKAHVITHHPDSTEKTFVGSDSFDFACGEIHNIMNSLNSDLYLGMPTHDDINAFEFSATIDPITLSVNGLNSHRIFERARARLANDTYRIIKPVYDEFKNSKTDAKVYAVSLFYKHWGRHLEQYIRSLKQITHFINFGEANQLQVSTYWDLLQIQMSKEEIEYIRYHSLVDEKISELLKVINEKIDNNTI